MNLSGEAKTKSLRIFLIVQAICLVAATIHMVYTGFYLGIALVVALWLQFAISWSGLKKTAALQGYDEGYIDAKHELWKTLHALVPQKGKLNFKSQDTSVYIRRNKTFLLLNSFLVIVTVRGDGVYDEDTLTRTDVFPKQSYWIYAHEPLVEKTTGATVVTSTKREDVGDIVTQQQPQVKYSLLHRLKARRNTPVDLAHATLPELKELNDLIVEQRENAS